MRKLTTLTTLYFIGLFVFLATGLCPFNWVYIVALIIGIIGLGYSLYKER